MEEFKLKFSKKSLVIIALAIVAIIICAVIYFNYFAAPERKGESERFVIPLSSNQVSTTDKLKTSGFIKSPRAFDFILGLRGLNNKILPGGYKISKTMNTWQIVTALAVDPYLKWVVIPEGLRKEEIADLLAESLNWSDAEISEWIKTDTTKKPDFVEGVYFPDTYVIPKDETTSQVADRLTAHFQEVFVPYSIKAIKQNIKWTTVIKLASIIQREAAGKDDMPLIAGILWNRLDNGQRLEVDSTLQYIRGKTKAGWWAPITLADKKIDSPYNTYLNKGLPPTPISNPGIEAISATLNPTKTDCFYYIHDKSGIIHCAITYEEHQKNINEYLR